MAEKPVLVFVPGMFCHAGFFQKLVDFFIALGYECLVTTMPYHDRLLTQPPRPELANLGILNYVEHLETIIEKLQRDFILVGHSMGGLIGMKTASLPNVHPKALILLSPAAPYGILALRYTVIKSFYPVLTTPSFWKIPISLSWENILYSMLNQVPEQEAMEIFEQMVWESGKAGFQMGFWVLDPAKATKFEPQGITCPIIIFSGQKDRITPSKVVKDTAKFLDLRPNVLVRLVERLWQLRKGQWEKQEFRRVKFISLPDMGHWLLTELDPDRILQEIERILNSQ